MKKIMTLLLVLVMATSLFAGCAKKVETKTESATTTETNKTEDTVATDSNVEESAPAPNLIGKKVVVGRWGGNDAETAAFAQVLKDFTTKTGVVVEERVYSDYNTELQAELIGGNGPDVFYVDAYMSPFYIQQGVLAPLDEKTFELDKFYTPLKNAFMQDGTYYAISKDYSTLGLYYNKKFVKEEDIPKTMEELWSSDFLTKLKASLPEGVAPMTYNQDLARQLFYAQAKGAEVTKDNLHSNIGDAKVVANLQLEYDAAIAGKIQTPADLGMGWNGDAFGNEKTAIMIEGNWSLGFLATNFPTVDFGVLELPTFDGKKGTMVFTVGYGINVKTKEMDAATAFVQYVTGVDGMATWTTGAGVLPSRDDVTLATKANEDPLKIAHIAGAEYATPWQKGTTMDTINNEYKNVLPSVIKGEKSLADALKSAQDEANKTIDSNQ